MLATPSRSRLVKVKASLRGPPMAFSASNGVSRGPETGHSCTGVASFRTCDSLFNPDLGSTQRAASVHPTQ